jgi:hypothetical protein
MVRAIVVVLAVTGPDADAGVLYGRNLYLISSVVSAAARR